MSLFNEQLFFTSALFTAPVWQCSTRTYNCPMFCQSSVIAQQLKTILTGPLITDFLPVSNSQCFLNPYFLEVEDGKVEHLDVHFSSILSSVRLGAVGEGFFTGLLLLK